MPAIGTTAFIRVEAENANGAGPRGICRRGDQLTQSSRECFLGCIIEIPLIAEKQYPVSRERRFECLHHRVRQVITQPHIIDLRANACCNQTNGKINGVGKSAIQHRTGPMTSAK